MSDLGEEILKFFKNVATKNTKLIATLTQEKSFKVNQGGWYFTLPDLYTYLQNSDENFYDIKYEIFRKNLYATNINEYIKPFGAEIKISKNLNNVDYSEYHLVWN